MIGRVSTTAIAAAMLAGGSAQAESITLNVSGLVSTHVHHSAAEEAFYDGLAERTGLDLTMNYNPLDVIGVSMDDTLRFAGDGTFDIVQSTLGNVARDEAFIDGLDLIGISPTMEDARAVVDAFREPYTERVAASNNAHTLTIFPYGPQLIFCNDEVTGLADLEGQRVRSYTRTMSALLEHLGATPVSMPFAEVYQSLQRGVVDCAITSITSANTGSWPELTDYVLTIGLSYGQNSHFINLDTWNSMSEEAREAMTTAFREFEDELWALTEEMYDDAMRCSTGQQPCEHYNEYEMTAVEPSEEDMALFAEASEAVVLEVWADACSPTEECVDIWNDTVGAVRGMEMAAN